MNKEIYIIRGTVQESAQEFFDRIFSMTTFLAKEINPEALKFTITEKEPPALTIIPFRKTRIAVISIYKSNAVPVNELRKADGFSGAYRVTEAFPVAYKKTWKDGERTPGVCLLTLFQKEKTIDYKTFINRWHNGHTPLSLRIHPLWNYVRNVSTENMYDNFPWFDGIVEEQFKEAGDLLNPFRFFGNPLIIIPRMLTVYSDTKSFIDYKRMEIYLASEYHIKTNPLTAKTAKT